MVLECNEFDRPTHCRHQAQKTESLRPRQRDRQKLDEIGLLLLDFRDRKIAAV